MAASGAEAAYRGYRLQALYILWRVLSSRDTRHIFRPEGLEDLAVYSEGYHLIEAVQVKAYSDSLALSDFSPDKSDSFLRRTLDIHKSNPEVAIKVVSFGPIGLELFRAWSNKGAERDRVTDKLLGFHLSSSDIDRLYSAVEFLLVSEATLLDEVNRFLSSSLVGGEPASAFDLLNYWLYLASERREEITYRSLLTRIESVGRYLAERATYQRHWFTSIVPIEPRVIPEMERATLAQEYYEGVAARYDHILAQADIARTGKLAELNRLVQSHQAVIIHGASGQGKSSLAFRYLHDYFPDQWRFAVQGIDGRQHAREIARALSGHARALGAPVVIYVDASPQDRDWPDLVRELGQLRELRVLVTIREEDWQRATVSKADFTYGLFELTFDEEEARQLYPKLTAHHHPETILTFEEAWRRFRSGGPLLEFVHLVVQNETLRERLRLQIRRISDEVRTGILTQQEIELLRLVAVASAYGGHIDAAKAVSALSLPAPRRTLELFEKEYLIRRSPDQKQIEGLHPVRSAILVELLTDESVQPWSMAACLCVPNLSEDSLETFLLHAFSRRRADAYRLLAAAKEHRPTTWVGVGGVLRACLWLGLSEYADANRQIIIEAYERFGAGWFMFLDFDVGRVSSDSRRFDLRSLDFVPEASRKMAIELEQRQTPKAEVYRYAREWLQASDGVERPKSLLDWAALAEVAFWTGHLGIELRLPGSFSTDEADSAVIELSIEHLANLVFGLSYGWRQSFSAWLASKKDLIVGRFRRETQTFAIDDGNTICAHFIVNPNILGGRESGPEPHGLNDQAMWRVELLRRIFPVRLTYACHGYGHRLGSLKLPFDETDKAIPVESLLPIWAVRLNSTFQRLGSYRFRAGTWLEYAQAIYDIRKRILDALEALCQALVIYFRKQKPVQLLGNALREDIWLRATNAANNLPLLPQCAVDEWGVTGENSFERDRLAEGSGFSHQSQTELSFSLQAYHDYLSALNEYAFSMSNFLKQSTHVLITNSLVGRATTSEQRESIRRGLSAQEIKTDLAGLVTHNFADALKRLPRFQREFRLHFYALFEQNILKAIEQRENKLYTEAWALWYQFAFRPSAVWQDALTEATHKYESVYKEILAGIRGKLKEVSHEGLRAIIRSRDLAIDDSPAIWISYDVSDPLQLFAAFDWVWEALRIALARHRDSQFGRSIIDFRLPHVLVIPLFRGKNHNRSMWKINSAILMSEEKDSEKNWRRYIPEAVPPGVFAQLSIDEWDSPAISLVEQFTSAIGALSLLVAQISDLKTSLQLDDVGAEIMQTQVTNRSELLGNALQQAKDRMSDVLHYAESVAKQDPSRQSDCARIVSGLADLKSNVLPLAEFGNEVRISLGDVENWRGRLELARVQAVEIGLHLMAYAI